jgi:hypothetical protein
MIQLISKSSTGKIRVVLLEYVWDDNIQGYYIFRHSGQFNGKMTQQPTVTITEGKAGRSRKQQVELQYNHLVKEKLDKGYKIWEKPLEESTEEELQEFIGEIVTNRDSVPKPMLAKQADKVVNTKIFDKDWYASVKIDGLRILIYMGVDGELHTSSRGAMNYDPAMYEILSNPTLIEIFKKYPGIILDGEGYKHGKSLQEINSVARTQVTAKDYEFLQFYLYDIVDPNKTFEERLLVIQEIANTYSLGFDPERVWNRGELRIQVVPHIKISGWDNMMSLHNSMVNEGWEGIVIRDPNSVYKPNGRSNDMIKIKVYSDLEAKVVGYTLGARGTEDMCFKCVLPNGIEFLAKPYGDRELKQNYVDNFEKDYSGKTAVVKYFYLSDDGVPLQPSLKCFRLEEDIPKNN